MDLRTKIVITLFAVVTVYAVSDHFVQQNLLSKRFVQLERGEALRDMERITAAIEDQLTQLDQLCLIKASRADARAFVSDAGGSYRETGLDQDTLRTERVDLLYFCAGDGRVIWGAIHDPETGRAATLREFPRQRLSVSHPLLARGRVGGRSAVDGIMSTERGPLLVAARAVLDPVNGQDIRGTLILGRFVADEMMGRIASQTGVPFARWQLDGQALGADEAEVLDDVTASVDPVIRERGDGELHVYTELADIRDQPSMLVRAQVPRDISRMGAATVRYALQSTLAACLILLLVLNKVLGRTILDPLTRLTDHAVAVGASDDLNARLELERADELGVLAREFDRMTERLAVSRSALLRTARAAGMSEIATGVLHNVGNVLNSASVSTAVLGEKARELGAEDLSELAETLGRHADDLASFVAEDPRGVHLRPFIEALAHNLEAVQAGIVAEVDSLNGGLEHIRELIESQQDLAGRGGISERCVLEERVEEALAFSTRAVEAEDDLQIERDYEGLDELLLERHKVVEILINLIQNARQAMAEGEYSPRRLGLRVRRTDERRVRVEISDNGVGISAGDLTRVFALGFTTRPDGHGFGLHSAANAATEMGGSLTVHSDGPGRGATFVLELPAEIERAGVEV
jgi:sensor domain CHASE-containing protein